MKFPKTLLPILVCLLVACQPEKPTFLTTAADTVPISQRVIADSSLAPKEFQLNVAEIDSLLRLQVNLPKLYDTTVYSPMEVTQFSSLARETGGETYFLTDSRKISQQILSIIDKHLEAKSDVVILIDKTGSMSDDIENIKKSVSSIIDRLRKKPDVRISIAAYGDKNADGKMWFQEMPLSTDFTKADIFVQRLILTSGGDYPESVFDGAARMMDSLKWRPDSKKMILLLGDAPSLTKPLSDYDLKDIVAKSKAHGVLMNYYPVIISPLGEMGEVVSPFYQEKSIINSVYPVPTTGVVNVLMNVEGYYDYELFDINGKLVTSGRNYPENFNFDFGDQENGVYVLRICNSKTKKFETRKIILEK